MSASWNSTLCTPSAAASSRASVNPSWAEWIVASDTVSPTWLAAVGWRIRYPNLSSRLLDWTFAIAVTAPWRCNESGARVPSRLRSRITRCLRLTFVVGSGEVLDDLLDRPVRLRFRLPVLGEVPEEHVDDPASRVAARRDEVRLESVLGDAHEARPLALLRREVGVHGECPKRLPVVCVRDARGGERLFDLPICEDVRDCARERVAVFGQFPELLSRALSVVGPSVEFPHQHLDDGVARRYAPVDFVLLDR